MKRYITIACVLIAAFLFASCQDAFDSEKSLEGQEAKLEVSIGGIARTLSPRGAELEGLEYWLIVRNYDYDMAEYVGVIEDISESVTFLLPAYRYTVIAEAYDADENLVARQEKSVALKSGEFHREKLTLVPGYTADVPGFFEYSLAYDDLGGNGKKDKYDDAYDDLEGVRLTLSHQKPNDGYWVEIVDLLDNHAGKLTVPPGIYNMTIELKSKRYSAQSQNIVSFKETVYIYPGKTTKTPVGKYVFESADFTAKIHLFGSATLTNVQSVTPPLNTSYNLSKIVLLPDGVSGNYNDPANWVDLGADSNLSGLSSNFDLFFDSHLIQDANRNSYSKARIGLLGVTGTGANAQYIYKAFNVDLENTKGSSSTDVDEWNGKRPLSMRTGPFILHDNLKTGGAIWTDRPAGGKVEINPTIARGGWTNITITAPPKYGIITGTILGTDTSVTNITRTSTAGVFDVGLNLPDYHANNAAVVLNYVGFFHLDGTFDVSGSLVTDNYKPVRIEAWEVGYGHIIGVYDPGKVEPQALFIKSVTPVAVSGTPDRYSYSFDLTDYIWRNTTDTTCFLKVFLEATGKDPISDDDTSSDIDITILYTDTDVYHFVVAKP